MVQIGSHCSEIISLAPKISDNSLIERHIGSLGSILNLYRPPDGDNESKANANVINIPHIRKHFLFYEFIT